MAKKDKDKPAGQILNRVQPEYQAIMMELGQQNFLDTLEKIKAMSKQRLPDFGYRLSREDCKDIQYHEGVMRALLTNLRLAAQMASGAVHPSRANTKEEIVESQDILAEAREMLSDSYRQLGTTKRQLMEITDVNYGFENQRREKLKKVNEKLEHERKRNEEE